jgi:uroporphyrinogen decarboxylase-like protein
MGAERARKALRGQATDCIPLLDQPTHAGFLQKLTGIDPFEDTTSAVVAALGKLDVDFLAFGLPEPAMRRADGKHQYGLRPTEWRHTGRTLGDLATYDPALTRSDLPGVDERGCEAQIRTRIDHESALVGDCLCNAGFTFTTCIHYAAEDLDWEEFLIACLAEEENVGVFLDRCQLASEKVFRAHAAAGVEVMFSHDDIAMSTGTVQSPDWLRRNVLRRYPEIWRPIKEAGVPLLFMTDGDFSAVADDLLEAGADGFFLDAPCMDLPDLVRRCGRDKVYYTGPSPAVMTTGAPGDVRDAVARLAEVARDLPRFFFHLPGGYTRNMPVENVQSWYEACREYGRR